MSRFDIVDTPLRGLKVLQRKPIGDARGYLERIFCATDLGELMAGRRIEQVNRTLTRQLGAVRGMHFQRAPHAETKVVTCLRGEILDVAVDLRSGSPTFLQWCAQRLSEGNGKTFFIPEGFAHGFQTLTEDCEVLYLHTAAYLPASEGGVSPLDSRLGIQWPLPIAYLSDRDAGHARLAADYSGIEL